MKDFNGDGLVGSFNKPSYVLGQPVQKKLSIFSYIYAAMLIVLGLFAILLVLGFDPAVELVGKIAELVIGGLK